MLRIPRSVLKKLMAHVESTYPEEGCGLLIGRIDGGIRVVTDCVPTANSYSGSSGSRRNRYAIDPLEYMRIEDSVSRNGMSVLGVFHSHPDVPAVPSKYDREHAFPLFSYLIVSVRRGKTEQVMAWRLDEVTWEFVEESLEVI